MGLLSTIYQYLTKDPAVTLTASYSPDAVDRRFIDNQMQGIQQHLVDSLIQSKHASWFRVSGTVAVGDVVCTAGIVSVDAFQSVTKALPTPLSTAGQPAGVVLVGAADNAFALVAIGGSVPANITQLAATSGVVRVSSTGRCERVAAIGVSDYRLGTVDAAGVLMMSTGTLPAASGSVSSIQLVVAAASTTAGQVVSSNSANRMVVATSNPTTFGFAGILLQTVGPLGTSTFLSSGPLDPAIYNLGAGAATAVGISAGGFPVRSTDPTCISHKNWVGFCDSGGNIHVQPRQETRRRVVDYGCPWDGVNDDSVPFQAMIRQMPLVGHDEIEIPNSFGYFAYDVEWNRSIGLIGVAGGRQDRGTGSGIYLAMGRSIRLRSSAVSSDLGDAAYSSISNVTFASQRMIQASPTIDATVLPGHKYAPFATTSFYPNFIWDFRLTSHTYYVGNCVVNDWSGGFPTNTAVFFRVLSTTGNAQVVGSTPGTFSSTTLPGVTIVDGNVTWISEAFPADWQATHAYNVGERAWKPGDPRHYYEVVVAGTSAGTIPISFGGMSLNQIVTDGTVVWRICTPAAIQICAEQCDFKKNAFLGITGLAYHAAAGENQAVPDVWRPNTSYANNAVVQRSNGAAWFRNSTGSAFTSGSTEPTWDNVAGHTTNDNGHNWTSAGLTSGGSAFPIVLGEFADFTTIDGGFANHCAGGVSYTGSNVNGSSVSNFNVNFAGVGQTIVDTSLGAGGSSIFNHSSGNTYSSVYSQFGSGPGNYSYGTSSGRYIGCLNENLYPDIHTAGDIVIGPPSANTASQACVLSGAYGCKYIAEQDSQSNLLDAALCEQNNQGIFPFSAGSVDPNRWGWRYQLNNVYSLGTGCYAMCMHAQSNVPTFGLYGRAAFSKGECTWRDYQGHYCGQEGDPNWYASLGPFPLTDKRIAGGSRILGDTNEQAIGVPGRWRGTCVTTAGYRGITWFSASSRYFGDAASVGYHADVVEPTAGTDQAWQYVDPLIWAPSTVYANGVVIRGSGNAQTKLIQNSTGGNITSGLVEPTWNTTTSGTTNDNGFLWTTRGTWGTSTVEPTWPSISVNATFVDTLGNTWKYLGPKAKYAKIGFIDDPVIALTSQTRGRRVDSVDTNAATVAAKTPSCWAIVQPSDTSAVTANQVLFTIDPTDATWLPLPDNATSKLLISHMLNGADNGEINIVVIYKRTGGGAPVLIGAISNTPTVEVGTADNLNISGNTVQIRCTPGSASTIRHALYIECFSRTT